MKTFWVQTLGCKVNHYESVQIACLLRSRGLVETADPARADLRVVNSCSVTLEAAAKSRQTARRLVRLPLLDSAASADPADPAASLPAAGSSKPSQPGASTSTPARPRVIVVGCWATSDPQAAASLPGVDAVLTHHGDVAADLDRLLNHWREGGGAARDVLRTHDPRTVEKRTFDPQTLTRKDCSPDAYADADRSTLARYEAAAPADTLSQPAVMKTAIPETVETPPEPCGNEGWMIEAGSPAGAATDARTPTSKADLIGKVNAEVDPVYKRPASAQPSARGPGTTRLPMLGEKQAERQRAVLKVQDGCDAHCTYCIIPRLRPTLWSRPVDDVVEEARGMVGAGHVEVVLTGIFLGAYGQPTALRRRQPQRGPGPLGELVDALCTRIPGLRRLRLSSLEPGDMTDGLLSVLRSHEQVVPHFHLPLQSGSDTLLRKMNRQYSRDDFLRMIDRLHAAFDRPALTTDVIVGFPGETDDEFRRTREVVDRARFIHVHAFPFSPRPGTAAARWAGDFVRGPVVNDRIELLRRRSDEHSFNFRRQFIGDAVEILVEHDEHSTHGRCERYFDVHFDHADAKPGDFLRVRVDEVTPRRTFGTVVGRGVAGSAPAGEAA